MQPVQEVAQKVINTGLPIDGDDIARIFEARFRSERANTKDPHGKGLGLYISKSLAEFMGGDIHLKEISSEKSIFDLQLPRMLDHV